MNRDQVGVNRNSFSVAQHERFLSKQFRKFRFSRAPGLLFPQREIVRCLSKAVFGVPRRANARRAPDERRYESGAGFAPVFMHIRLAKLAKGCCESRILQNECFEPVIFVEKSVLRRWLELIA